MKISRRSGRWGTALGAVAMAAASLSLVGGVMAAAHAADTQPTPTTPGEPPEFVSADPAAATDYRCAVLAGSLNLRTHAVGLRIVSPWPHDRVPGEVLPATDFDVVMTLPNMLRDTAKVNLFAESFGAEIKDFTTVADLGPVSAGGGNDRSVKVVKSLVAPQAPIPGAGSSWEVPFHGTYPVISTSTGASGPVSLEFPGAFSVAGTITDDLGDPLPMTFNCTAGLDSTPPTPTTPTPTTPATPPVTESTPTTPPTPTTPVEPPEFVPAYPAAATNYRCAVLAGSLNLRYHAVGLRIVSPWPHDRVPGEVLPATDFDVVMTLPNTLRDIVKEILYSESFGAEITDFTTVADLGPVPAGGGNDRSVKVVRSLVAPQAPIPGAGSSWEVPFHGTYPVISTSTGASGPVSLQFPGSFSVAGTITDDLGKPLPATFNCTAGLDSTPPMPTPPTPTTPATPPVTESTPTTPTPTTPVTPPVTESTPTAPVTPPTTVPTMVPTTPGPVVVSPKVSVGAVGLWRSALLTVSVTAPNVTATGRVTVTLGSRKVAETKLFGGVAVLLPTGLPAGRQTLTITYAGHGKIAAKTVTKQVQIF